MTIYQSVNDTQGHDIEWAPLQAMLRAYGYDPEQVSGVRWDGGGMRIETTTKLHSPGGTDLLLTGHIHPFESAQTEEDL